MKFDKYRQSLALIGARQPRGRERGRGLQSSRVDSLSLSVGNAARVY